MVENERNFIEVENLNGEKETVEIIGEIKSERDDKLYALVTPDKTLGDEISIVVVQVIEKEDNINLEFVENQEELNYVYSLINKKLNEVA